MRDILIREYRPGDASLICYHQMVLYRDLCGYKQIFEHYLLEGMDLFIRAPEGGNMWVAETKGQMIGSIAVCRLNEGEAQLRWFWVDGSERGSGVGTALFSTALDFCKENGYSHVILWTESTLKIARRMYSDHGFVLTRTKPNREWADHLVTEEEWELGKKRYGDPSFI